MIIKIGKVFRFLDVHSSWAGFRLADINHKGHLDSHKIVLVHGVDDVLTKYYFWTAILSEGNSSTCANFHNFADHTLLQSNAKPHVLFCPIRIKDCPRNFAGKIIERSNLACLLLHPFQQKRASRQTVSIQEVTLDAANNIQDRSWFLCCTIGCSISFHWLKLTGFKDVLPKILRKRVKPISIR